MKEENERKGGKGKKEKRKKKEGVWVGVWFIFRLYYPFGKGPGQHIIRCLKNKKCENEQREGDGFTGVEERGY